MRLIILNTSVYPIYIYTWYGRCDIELIQKVYVYVLRCRLGGWVEGMTRGCCADVCCLTWRKGRKTFSALIPSPPWLNTLYTYTRATKTPPVYVCFPLILSVFVIYMYMSISFCLLINLPATTTTYIYSLRTMYIDI